MLNVERINEVLQAAEQAAQQGNQAEAARQFLRASSLLEAFAQGTVDPVQRQARLKLASDYRHRGRKLATSESANPETRVAAAGQLPPEIGSLILGC